MGFLTDRTLATGVTLQDLIHIVITGDTSQGNFAGSSYKATIQQVSDAIMSGLTGNTLYEVGTGTDSTQRIGVGSDASGNCSLVGGGKNNTASCDYSTVNGGRCNTSSCYNATVSGGYLNTSSNYSSTVSGGWNNTSIGHSATIGGGYFNTSSGPYSTVSGGRRNVSTGNDSTVSGGIYNTSIGCYQFIGGGSGNTTSNSYSVVGGGQANTASGIHSIVLGGFSNKSICCNSTVSGGKNNTSSGCNSFIGGGSENTASNSYSFVGGGQSNIAYGIHSVVGGGQANKAACFCNFVGGGGQNTALGFRTTIAGGRSNTTSSTYSVISGGWCNKAICAESTIGGGRCNSAFGNGSSILGGLANTAFCNYGTILGGSGNTVNHELSGAFGKDVKSVSACTLHVNYLALQETPETDSTNDNMLVRDVSTGVIKTRNIATTLNNYGSYLSENDQPIGVVGTTYTMSADTQISASGFILSNGGRFTVGTAGVYNIQFSAQLEKNAGASSDVYIWLYKNGLNVTSSNTELTLAGASGDRVVAAWNFLDVASNVGDYYEIRWTATNTNTFLSADPTPAYGPARPSVIITITQSA